MVRQQLQLARRWLCSSSSKVLPSVTRYQLRAHFVSNAIPMIGFGFMDQTVMVHAGNAIDLTFGVTFGLSTLSAAACGQICSDVAGVTFGGAIESLAAKCGLPDPKLSSKQQSLAVVHRVGFFGRIAGVVLGCVLGLTNLFMVDATKTQQLKLERISETQTEHSVAVSNRDRDDATTVTVHGPDTDGLLASIATTLAAAGYSLMEVRGGPSDGDTIRDVFSVTKGGNQIPDDHLEQLARCVVDACRNPKQARRLQVDNEKLRLENHELKDKLHKIQHERKVRIARTDTRHIRPLSSSDDEYLSQQEEDHDHHQEEQAPPDPP